MTLKNKFTPFTLLMLCLFFCKPCVRAQDDMYESLLQEEVEVENPVYMPVIGVGEGVVNYMGDIENELTGFGVGNHATKINISTFLGDNQYFKGNFFILFLASISGEQYFYDAPEPYFYNFKTEFVSFGLNVQYSFEPFFKRDALIKPFLSLGVEVLQFNAVTDIKDDDGNPYNLKQDGTYRDVDGNIITRNYGYETDLRREMDFGMGNYAKTTVAFPVGAGLELRINERAFLQMGTGLHFTTTDLLDHVSHENTQGIIGKKGNDKYVFSYATFHYDLFSDPQTVTVQRLFADIEFDHTMYGDEDGDWVFDRIDQCLGTPQGVEVDSIGCSIDGDGDGIPDYIDLEPNTPPNSFVDNYGQALTIEQIVDMLKTEAASREDVDRIIRSNISGKHQARLSNVVIPDKFKSLDVDGDGFISYEEFMKELDRFFDFESDYSVQEIEELKEFFFSQ